MIYIYMYIIYIIPMKISILFLSHGEFQARPQAARAFRSLSRADAEALAAAKSPGHGGLNGKIMGKPIGKPSKVGKSSEIWDMEQDMSL